MHDKADTALTVPLGRRERNKQRVRSRLYECAMTLFAEKGYEQTSIDEIAEAADVARGTFFNYFQRKEDLVVAWGENRRTQLREELLVPVAGVTCTLRGTLEHCMRRLADLNEAERETTRAMLTAWVKSGRAMTEEPYSGRIFADIVEAARARGETAPAVDPTHVGNLLRDGYLGNLYRWCQRPDARPGELHETLLTMTDIVLLGITPPCD